MKTVKKVLGIYEEVIKRTQASVLILDQNGALIYAGAPQFKKAILWNEKTPESTVNDEKLESDYTHGYMVWDSLFYDQPCQVIFTIPFVNGDSNHGAIRQQWGKNALKYSSELMAGLDPSFSLGNLEKTYSGECYADASLCIETVRDMVANRKKLSGIVFNLKGNATDKYRDGPVHELNSYIPSELIVLHPVHDKNITLIAPEQIEDDFSRLSLPSSSSISSGAPPISPRHLQHPFFSNTSQLNYPQSSSPEHAKKLTL